MVLFECGVDLELEFVLYGRVANVATYDALHGICGGAYSAETRTSQQGCDLVVVTRNAHPPYILD